uniref:Uncharacterized protein n=1 Tax=Chrysotila carterae TaxID=13221 RepID=A0A6S9YJP5_CHRCT
MHVLRAASGFKQAEAECQNDFPRQVVLTSARVLLEYLSNGFEAAQAIFDERLHAIEAFQLGSRAHEDLLCEWVWLLCKHAATHATPPRLVRDTLANALGHFPANSTFLQALMTSGGSVHSRFHTRRLLAGVRSAHPKCPQAWLASVRFELETSAAASDEAATAAARTAAEAAAEPLSIAGHRRSRQLLESALRPSTCGACPALWQLYMQLETRAGRDETACRVQVRSIQQCPGFKELWLQGLRPPLLLAMPDRLLRDTTQLLAEKELRLRSELPAQPEPSLEAMPRPHAPRTHAPLDQAAAGCNALDARLGDMLAGVPEVARGVAASDTHDSGGSGIGSTSSDGSPAD